MMTDTPIFTLLLTGAGGIATPTVVAHLQEKGVRVLAVDMNPMAPGLVIADRGYCVPAATSPNFVEKMRGICDEEDVDIVVPLVDEELMPVQELASEKLHILTPRPDFIATCLDKFRLCRELENVGVPHPQTYLAGVEIERLPYPVILKPRTGRGSRGVFKIDSEDDMRRAIANLDRPIEELMVQEYIDGPEYTVSVVAGPDGEVQAVVPKEIIVKKGVTQMAVTRRQPAIEKLCKRLQETFRADGPFNVQLRLHPDSGEPLLFEINPRFSTTVTHTMAAGIDELFGLAVQAVVGRHAHQFGTWKEDLVLRRRSVDEFLSEADFREEQRSRICDVR